MARLLETADPEFGGWGLRQKFPHPEALHFALVRWSRDGDEKTLHLVTQTLQKMQAGAIHDRVAGGFFRYARTPDWGQPQFQKMLGSNAQRLLAYGEAYQALGTDSFRATACGILDWLGSTLLDAETGAFWPAKTRTKPTTTWGPANPAPNAARHRWTPGFTPTATARRSAPCSKPVLPWGNPARPTRP